MIALKLNEKRNFLSHLLIKETFDSFQFIEGEIITYNTFSIDGFIQKEFFDSDEKLEEFSFWRDIKSFCFSIIKGKQPPLSFKFVFRLSPENTKKLLQSHQIDLDISNIQGLYLNIRLRGSDLQCVTGTSLKTFSLDKSLEHEWDQLVLRFFSKNNIAYEQEA